MPAPDATEPNGTTLSPAHLRHHGLQSQPFDGLPNPDFIYRDSAMDVQVKLLRDRLETDDRLLLLIGDPGVGTSTHVQRLLEQDAGSRLCCVFQASPGATFTAIEQALHQYWTPPTQKHTEIPVAEFLNRLCSEDPRPILVIDDAHHLAPAVLAALLEFRHEVRRRCGRTPGVLLAGTPELGRLIEDAVDGDAAVTPRLALFLQPLTGEQTEAYLRHRLQAAGAKAPDLLGGAIAQAIYQESAGHPREINRLANRHLQDPATPTATAGTVSPVGAGGPSRISALLRNPRAAGLVLAGALGGLVLLVLISSPFRFASDSDASRAVQPPLGTVTLVPSAEKPRNAPASPQILTSEREAPAVTPAAPAETSAPDAPATSGADGAQVSRPPSGLAALTESPLIPNSESAVHAPDAAARTLEAADPAQARRSEVPGSEVPGSEAPGSEAPGPEAPGPEAPGSEVSESDTVPTDTVPTDTGTTDTVTADTAPAVPVATVSVRVESAPAAATEADPEPPQPQPLAQSPTPEASAATPVRLQETNWLRDQNANHLSVQIAASHDLQALQGLARTLRLDADLAWFQTRREGRYWYTLVVGPYPSVARARAAVTELPASVQRQQPWVRSFASIHKALDEAN